MFKRNLMSLAVGALLATGTITAYATTPAAAGEWARESSEGPRGADKDRQGGRDNERPGDRHRGRGRG